MALPILPPILTNANWQKEKGVVAKVVKKETGLGALMDSLGTAFNAVTWTKFDCKMALPSANVRSVEAVEKAIVDAKAEYAKVPAVQKAAYALRDKANATAAEWSKSKLIPSSSRKHVEEVAKAADVLGVSCKSMDFKSFDEVKKELADNEEKAKGMLATWIASIKTGISAVTAKPTIEEYNAKLYQKVRGLGTAIGCIKALKPTYSPIWGNGGMAGGNWISDATTPEKMKAKLKTIQTELVKFEQAIK